MSTIKWSEWYQYNQHSLNTYVPESQGIYEIRTDYIFGRLKGYSQTVRIGKADRLKQRLGGILNEPDKNRTIEEKRLIQKGHTFEFRFAKAESGEVAIQMENESMAEYVMEYWELPPCIRNFPKEVVKILKKEWKLES